MPSKVLPDMLRFIASTAGMTFEYEAQTSGEGAKVKWTGRVGTGALELTDCAPGVGVSYRTTVSLGGMSAVGRMDVQRDASAVVVSWSDELSVGKNPLWRWLAFAMDGVRKRNVAQGLAALKRVSEDG